MSGPQPVPSEIILLLLVLGLLIFMWDLFDRRSKLLRKSTGLADTDDVISVQGGGTLPASNFFSEELALSSKPDALIRDGEFLIPVDIHPMTNKVHDRHIVSLFVHLKLIEKIHGRRPPHGILLMGKDKRHIRITNSPEKELWLDAILAEMHSIAEHNIPAVPAPKLYKCKNCDVRNICSHNLYTGKSTD